MLNAIDRELLATVADLHQIPQGAYNIRKDGKGLQRRSTENIVISPKRDRPGIDVMVRPGTRNESVHIPVLLTLSGLTDIVFNTFDIGEGSDVLVVAGCGIHNPGSETARHDGVHEILVRKGARIRYLEKHVGQGEGSGGRILNPKTVITLEKGAIAELELTQIRGVDSARRITEATLHEGAKLVVTERLLTHGSQESDSTITVALVAAEAAADLKSRSVARDESRQSFVFRIAAAAPARGHIECNTIIMERARVRSVPEISAEDPGAEVTHEAAIGKIAAEQLIKLQSLGLSASEAIDIILSGFLGTRTVQ